MAIWKQILLCVAVGLLALLIAAKLSPVTASFLANHGLSAPMQALGLTDPAATDATAGQNAATGAGGGKPAGTADAGGSGQKSGKGAGRKATVVLQPAGTAIINDKVTALGTGAALQSVTVLPKANGTLTEISAASGAQVSVGQVIARLDSDTQQIAREKARLAADDAKLSLERNRALVQSNAAPANQTQAVELAANMADLAVRAADQDLADRAISAPIAGVLGIIKVSVGNAVTPQTPIVTIEDSSSLVINFWLPERLAGQVKVGDPASLVPVSRPDVTLAAKIASIDNQIDPASGTFQVQAQVANPDGSLRPGMSFTVAMQFAGDSYVTVNPLSVQWGSSGAYVWRFADGKVDKVPVSVVQRNTETVLVAGAVKEGDAIVTEGLDGLKPGADVQVFGAPAAAQDGAAQSGGAQTGAAQTGGTSAATSTATSAATSAAAPLSVSPADAAQAATTPANPGTAPVARTGADGAAGTGADASTGGDGSAAQGSGKHKRPGSDPAAAGN